MLHISTAGMVERKYKMTYGSKNRTSDIQKASHEEGYNRMSLRCIQYIVGGTYGGAVQSSCQTQFVLPSLLVIKL